MLCSSGWRSLFKTLGAGWSKRTGYKFGTRYKMIDNMFKFQVIGVQVFSSMVRGLPERMARLCFAKRRIRLVDDSFAVTWTQCGTSEWCR